MNDRIAALLSELAGSPELGDRAVTSIAGLLAREARPADFASDVYSLPPDLQSVRIGRHGQQEVIYQLVEFIDAYPSNPINHSIIWAIGKAFPDSAFEPLLELIEDAWATFGDSMAYQVTTSLGLLLPMTRRGTFSAGAERALRRHDPTTVLQEWSYAMDDGLAESARSVLDDIIRASRRLRGETADLHLAELGSSDTTTRKQGIRALERLRERRVVPPLLDALCDPEPIVRATAARALGTLRDHGAVPSLLKSTHDPAARVRLAAISALGRIRAPRTVVPLTYSLEDDDYPVRRGAAEALGLLGRLLAVRPLLRAVKDGRLSASGAAADALGKLGKPAVFALVAALNDGNAGVRECAAHALTFIQDSRAAGPIRAILPTLSADVADHLEWAMAFAFADRLPEV